MNKQIERILICVLWLLAATLGTSFWLNTLFGFNIFSTQHWQYLAYLQAAQTTIRPAFYISLTLAICITLGVLYILIRPNGIWRRRIRIGRITNNQTASPSPENIPTAPVSTTVTTPAPIIPARPNAPQIQRPNRPNIPTIGTHGPEIHITTATQPQPAPSIDFDELNTIFSDAGYTIKKRPQIGNFKPALMAIGTQETVWMGGVGIDQATLLAAMERLGSIFSDTLDDIQINIYGFIIAPTSEITNPDIIAFKNISQLREYIENNKNTPPTDADGKENFDAYSEYIDTVIKYMDNT